MVELGSIQNDSKKKRKRPQQSALNPELATLEAREHAAATDRLQGMMRPRQQHPIQATGASGDEGMPFELPLNEPLREEDDNDNQLNLPTLESYLKGPTYQQRLVREENDWNEVIRALFIEYMIKQGETSSWGHPTLWDKDWNEDCQCPRYEQRTRTIDAYDIISPFYFFTQFRPSHSHHNIDNCPPNQHGRSSSLILVDASRM